MPYIRIMVTDNHILNEKYEEVQMELERRYQLESQAEERVHAERHRTALLQQKVLPSRSTPSAAVYFRER